jgi:carboxymethylenebutenolidase
MAPLQSEEFGKSTVERLKKCVDFLLAHQNVNDNVGVMGFCFGGTYTYEMAIADPRIHVAIPFYGHAPEPFEKLKDVSCPVYAFYGEQDENLVKQIPGIKENMEKYEKQFEVTTYPNTGHAFFNDTNPTTYNEEAAKDAWTKSLEALNKNLK